MNNTSLADVKKYIGEILSKPPLDMVDCSTINFMRNDAYSSGHVEQDVTFYDEDNNITFTAHITCGHSPMGLHTPAVLWALQEYVDLTGQCADWSHAVVHPYFKITPQELNEALNSRDLQLQTFLGFLTERNLQPLQALNNSINLLSKTAQNGVQFAPQQIDLAFLPVHAALLNQSKNSILSNANGQEMKKTATSKRLWNAARRRFSFR